MANFATTRIPIRFFFGGITWYQSPRCQCSWTRFYTNCHNFITSYFLGTITARALQIAENFARIVTMENKIWLYVVFLQKYVYDGPKYMIGIWILSCWIQIFFNRSGSLKDLWQFTDLSASNVRAVARARSVRPSSLFRTLVFPMYLCKYVSIGKRKIRRETEAPLHSFEIRSNSVFSYTFGKMTNDPKKDTGWKDEGCYVFPMYFLRILRQTDLAQICEPWVYIYGCAACYPIGYIWT
jgi:hypothetical protein